MYDSEAVPLGTELHVIDTQALGGEQGTSRSRDQKWMPASPCVFAYAATVVTSARVKTSSRTSFMPIIGVSSILLAGIAYVCCRFSVAWIADQGDEGDEAEA